MSKLDVAKERIGYYKVWLGVLLAVLVSVIGWTYSTAGTVSYYQTAGAIFVGIAAFLLVLRLHKLIERAINRLEKL